MQGNLSHTEQIGDWVIEVLFEGHLENRISTIWKSNEWYHAIGFIPIYRIQDSWTFSTEVSKLICNKKNG